MSIFSRANRILVFTWEIPFVYFLKYTNYFYSKYVNIFRFRYSIHTGNEKKSKSLKILDYFTKFKGFFFFTKPWACVHVSLKGCLVHSHHRPCHARHNHSHCGSPCFLWRPESPQHATLCRTVKRRAGEGKRQEQGPCFVVGWKKFHLVWPLI